MEQFIQNVESDIRNLDIQVENASVVIRELIEKLKPFREEVAMLTKNLKYPASSEKIRLYKEWHPEYVSITDRQSIEGNRKYRLMSDRAFRYNILDKLKHCRENIIDYFNLNTKDILRAAPFA